MNSSIPLQIFIFYNSIYLILFYCVEAGCLIYKGILLPYSEGILIFESLLLCILACISVIQVYCGSKGNLSEDESLVVFFLIISIPVFGGFLYFLIWQTYIFWIEVIVILIELMFIVIEIVFASLSFITFPRDKQATRNKKIEDQN